MNEVYCGDNLSILKEIKSESVNFIYIDPPFNTGKKQKLEQIKVERSEDGDRTGYQGLKYKTIKVGNNSSYTDNFEDYEAFLRPRLEELYRILAPDGTLCFHIDYREVHYCKVLLDTIFGRKSFLNEVIWHWDYGAKSKKKWSCKHNSILIYHRKPNR